MKFDPIQMVRDGHRASTSRHYIFHGRHFDINCFVEGEIDKFYYSCPLSAIMTPKGIKYRVKPLGSRDEVITAFHESRKMNHDKTFDTKSIFVVDRDYFPCEILSSNLWETWSYSIENYYCHIESVQQIFESLIADDDESTEIAMQLYKSLYRSFLEKSIDLNTWAKFQRLMERHHNIHDKLNFKDLPLNNIIQINNWEVFVNFNPNEVSIKGAFLPNINIAIFNKIKTDFLLTTDKHSYFRGKFNLSFLIKFIQEIKIHYDNKDDVFSDRRGTNKMKQVQGDFALKVFSQFAHFETDLIDFLEFHRDNFRHHFESTD